MTNSKVGGEKASKHAINNPKKCNPGFFVVYNNDKKRDKLWANPRKLNKTKL